MNEILDLKQEAAEQVIDVQLAERFFNTFKSCCYGSSFISNRNDSHNYCRTNFVLSGFKT